MLNAVFTLAVLLASPPSTDVQSLSWMSGRWAGSQDGTESEEFWTDVRGGTILGMHRDTKGGKTAGYEFFRIETVPEGLTFFASPQGRPPTPFVAIENGKGRIVFENKAHDFPTRILYWLGSDGKLHAKIEGMLDGKPASEEWSWSRKP